MQSEMYSYYSVEFKIQFHIPLLIPILKYCMSFLLHY